MAQDVGEGYFEGLTIRDGAALVRGKHRFLPERNGQLLQIAETSITFNEPALIIQSAAAGCAVVKDNMANQEFTLSNEQSIFQYTDHIKFSRDHDASQPNELYYLAITRSVLYDLVGEGVATKILSTMRMADAPLSYAYRLPSNISAILHSSMTNRLTGDFMKLYAQGKLLEYLSVLSDFILGEAATSIPPRRAKMVRRLHEEMLSLRGEVPNLAKLSKQYGLSAKTLNNDFKKEFGQSIYAYMKDQRLCEAHTKLLETDMPIKVIAAEFGYTHAANFMLAFKKKFGYPPGSLRR